MSFEDTAYAAGTVVVPNWGFCIYGGVGTRKTSSLRTMPGKGMILDWPVEEGGTNVMARTYPRVRVRSMTSWKDLDEAYWFFAEENLKRPKRDFPALTPDDDPRWEAVRYEWLAFDTISAAQNSAKHKLYPKVVDSVTKKIEGISQEPKLWAPRDWGKLGDLMADVCYMFKTLPIVICWIGQERTQGEENDKVIGPNLSPQSLQALNPSMMLIARFYKGYLKGEVDYRVRLEGTPSITAKYRADPTLDVPHVIRNVHLGNLLKYLMLGKGDRPQEVIEERPPELEFED